MLKKKTVLVLAAALLTLFFFSRATRSIVYADDTCTCPADQDELTCNHTKSACWQSKISEKQAVANTLGNMISIMNGQIVVQQLQVDKTKLEIAKLQSQIQDLGIRIDGLNVSLDSLTNVLIQRVNANYRRSQSNPLNILIVSNTVSSFFTRYKYLQIAQRHTQQIMKQAETQKVTFDHEKTLKELAQVEVNKKKVQLLAQEASLAKQRADQQLLLQQTKNDEARYQQELAKTLAEQAAIESLIAGNGDEQRVREVNQGDQIATVIPGASVCSTGQHLHFEVVIGNMNHDPANFLKPIDGIIWNNDPDGPFPFTGSWDWPLNNAAKINQGYGMTWYARVRRAYGGAPHTGIDMFSKSPDDYSVKAVKSGTLYRGSIHCGYGRLRYVKVDHHDGKSTFYLHVNY